MYVEGKRFNQPCKFEAIEGINSNKSCCQLIPSIHRCIITVDGRAHLKQIQYFKWLLNRTGSSCYNVDGRGEAVNHVCEVPPPPMLCTAL